MYVEILISSSLIGFDPWDVSQQGLADLLETEAEEQRRPLTNGTATTEKSFSALPNRTANKSHDPWQDEFRAIFPDVNISFGGKIFVKGNNAQKYILD